jgi:hypothetical protein
MWYSSRCGFIIAAVMIRDVCLSINHLLWLVPLAAWHHTSESSHESTYSLNRWQFFEKVFGSRVGERFALFAAPNYIERCDQSKID